MGRLKANSATHAPTSTPPCTKLLLRRISVCVGGLKPVRPLPMAFPYVRCRWASPYVHYRWASPYVHYQWAFPYVRYQLASPTSTTDGHPLRPLPMGIPLRPLPIPPLLALLCTIWPLLWLGVGGFAKPVFTPVALLRELIPPLRPETMGPPRRLEPIPPRRPLLTPMLGFKVGGRAPTTSQILQN